MTERLPMNSEEMPDSRAIAAAPVASRYDYPEKALRKWAQNYLTLNRHDDGGARGRFRFNGSTCMNGGMPLSCEYEVEIGPPAEGSLILSMTCRPADGDEGHRSMCVFRENAAAFARALSTEAPLQGRSLAEALDWNPPTNPAGCLCTSENRNHKWRMVLQTLHYALTIAERSPSPCE